MTQAIAKPSLIQGGPQGTSIVNAADSLFHDKTTLEDKITAAVAQAVTLGATGVYLPASFLPYNASLVTFNSAIRMLREGGRFDVFDVLAYGCFKDGSTDDRVAIQAADTAAEVVQGTVWFPTGTYRVSIGGSGWALGINAPVNWVGEPNATLQLAPNLGVGTIIRINTNTAVQLGATAASVTIRGLTLDGNGLQTGYGIQAINTTEVLVTENRFTRFSNNGATIWSYACRFEGTVATPTPFVWTAAAAAGFGIDNRVTYNTFDGFTGTNLPNTPVGIFFTQQDGGLIQGNGGIAGIGINLYGVNRSIKVTGNDFHDCFDTGLYMTTDVGGDNNRTRDHVISANIFRNALGDSGIKANGSRTLLQNNVCEYCVNSGIKSDWSSDLSIVGNKCSNNTNRAIYLEKTALAGYGGHDGAIIANNLVLDDAADGIFVEGGGDTGAIPATNIRISGNRAARCAFHGIRVYDCDSRLQILGNECMENGAAGAIWSGIFVRATNLSWSGATIAFNRCAGLVTGNSATAKQPFGIYFDAASGKTMGKCYLYFNDCSDQPDVTAGGGAAISTLAARTGGGTVSGQLIVGSLYRNVSFGVNQAAVTVSLQTTDTIVSLDESVNQGILHLESGPSVVFRASGLSSASVSDVSFTSKSILGNTLSTNGQALRVTVTGQTTGTGTGTINLKFGATAIFNSAGIASGTVFTISAIITRTGATAQLATVTSNLAAVLAQTRTAPAETLSGAVLLDFRGNVSAGTATLFYDSILVEELGV